MSEYHKNFKGAELTGRGDLPDGLWVLRKNNGEPYRFQRDFKFDEELGKCVNCGPESLLDEILGLTLWCETKDDDGNVVSDKYNLHQMLVDRMQVTNTWPITEQDMDSIASEFAQTSDVDKNLPLVNLVMMAAIGYGTALASKFPEDSYNMIWEMVAERLAVEHREGSIDLIDDAMRLTGHSKP